MSLVTITADLEAQWQRTVRRHQPTIRWAAADPAIPADAAQLRARLADHFGTVGRDLLRRIVTLAADGDHDAALAATLTVLGRLVRWEPAAHQRRNAAPAQGRDVPGSVPAMNARSPRASRSGALRRRRQAAQGSPQMTFAATAPKGALLRLTLPRGEAQPCYLAGFSNLLQT